MDRDSEQERIIDINSQENTIPPKMWPLSSGGGEILKKITLFFCGFPKLAVIEMKKGTWEVQAF